MIVSGDKTRVAGLALLEGEGGPSHKTNIQYDETQDIDGSRIVRREKTDNHLFFHLQGPQSTLLRIRCGHLPETSKIRHHYSIRNSMYHETATYICSP